MLQYCFTKSDDLNYVSHFNFHIDNTDNSFQQLLLVKNNSLSYSVIQDLEDESSYPEENLAFTVFITVLKKNAKITLYYTSVEGPNRYAAFADLYVCQIPDTIN